LMHAGSAGREDKSAQACVGRYELSLAVRTLLLGD
jgi:hypothetical protein